VMRPLRPLTYRLHSLPPVPAVLEFMADELDMDARAAYTTFNMGAGWAVSVCPEPHSAMAVPAIASRRLRAINTPSISRIGTLPSR